MYQVWIKKTNTSEPPLKRRNLKMVSKPGFIRWPGISLAGTCLLARWHPAYRWRELGPGSLAELREPVVAMQRERHKQGDCEADSTDALHRDGQVRSSDEAAVMAVERRDLAAQLGTSGQLQSRRNR